jgi:hypothetical protein
MPGENRASQGAGIYIELGRRGRFCTTVSLRYEQPTIARARIARRAKVFMQVSLV